MASIGIDTESNDGKVNNDDDMPSDDVFWTAWSSAAYPAGSNTTIGTTIQDGLNRTTSGRLALIQHFELFAGHRLSDHLGTW
jgi:hypothetical protein